MKRFLMLVAVAAVAGAMYVAASPASQQAKGPTLKQFNALKKQVATLSKQVKTIVKPEADAAVAIIGACYLKDNGNGTASFLVMPVSQRGTTVSAQRSSRRRAKVTMCRARSPSASSGRYSPSAKSAGSAARARSDRQVV